MSLIASSSSTPSASAVNHFDEGLTSETIQKYRTAAEIANETIKLVIGKVAAGVKIVELCQFGDDHINQRTSKVYSKGNFEKGLAFPTSISTNHCAGHFSPYQDSQEALKEGDLVKIDLAVHIDGYIAAAAQTVVVGTPASPKIADVITAAYQAAEIAYKLIKPGKSSAEVTAAIQKVAASYHTKPLEGVLSHQLSRFVIDGDRVIANLADSERQVDSFTFAEGEVYCLDVVISSGEGKTHEEGGKTTIFKRNASTTYSLKVKSSRSVFGEILRRFPVLPFTARSLEDPKVAKMGLIECINHDLLQPFPILYEKEGEYIAQFKTTILVTSSGVAKITETSLPEVQSEYSLEDEELKVLLTVKPKSKPKKKANKSKEAAEEPEKADEQ